MMIWNRRYLGAGLVSGALLLVGWDSGVVLGEEPEKEFSEDVESKGIPATVGEARIRARILHDSIHRTLQLVHRDFFDPLEKDVIPSETLSEVFEALEEDWSIKIRWLGVQGKTMNVDHKPRDKFERDAVKNLAAGKQEFESVDGVKFQRAAPIVLHNACLKCHVPNRKSLEDRVAGLVITMPLARH